ncbi:MAG: GAF domain-containing protein, partial [Dehalococcoidia bacterium]|nr:GAF domain-containing protein [Dehalococcoidia bacterium]
MGKQLSGFNRALGDIARAINSDLTSGEKLHYLVKTAAAALGVKGCSVMLLDAQKRRLFHAAAHGLSERYLRKGFLEADKSVADVLEGKTWIVPDMCEDPHVQFRDLAQEERIVSTITVPVKIKEEAVGILRAYSRIRREFTPDEIQFLSTAASLAGVVLQSGQAFVVEPESDVARNESRQSLAAQVKTAAFAHPSEEEFARVLDFYQIDWIYEPRSFTLFYEDKPPELFTPDFYLPSLDLYIEMTTLKATLMREKKRRVKRLGELYPDINIKLLARRDYDRI